MKDKEHVYMVHFMPCPVLQNVHTPPLWGVINLHLVSCKNFQTSLNALVSELN